MLLFKKYSSPKNQKFGLAALAASSAALLALATPAAANPFTFSQRLDSSRTSDSFGRSLALDGNYALIGAYSYSWASYSNSSNPGFAYLFDTSTGDLLQKITSPDGANYDYFGWSVALDGDYALIGATGDDDNGSSSGSAYLLNIVTGDFLQKFIAPDGAASDWFGGSVALNGDYALIGANRDDNNNEENSGSAYLFDTTTGDLLHKLTAPNGASNDWFGNSLALDGNYALIGAYGEDENGENSGSAYLFDVTSGDLIQKIIAPDSDSEDIFGVSVAIDGNHALIGASGDDDNGRKSGSAYLFDVSTGDLIQKIVAPDTNSYDYFGRSVALDEDYALISSSGNSSAYLFDVSSGDLIQKIYDPNNDYYDSSFGESVALDGNYALVSGEIRPYYRVIKDYAYLFAAERTKKVPEPSGFIGLVAISTLAAFKRSSRQQKQ